MRKWGLFTRRPVLTLTFLASVLAATASRAATPATTQSTDRQIADLIQLLASPDPSERDQAQASLINIGEPARASLVAATADANPAIATGAASTIYQLPWYLPDDPPEIRQLLANYSELNATARMAAINAIAQFPQGAYRTMLHIVALEPNDQVRWAIAWHLESNPILGVKAAVRAAVVVPDSTPVLALAGWAWEDDNKALAGADFQKALAQWNQSPHEVTSIEQRVLFDPLYLWYWNGWQYDKAADVLRTELQHTASDSNLLFTLFALHADFGPLKGYEDDCVLAGDQLDTPLLLLCRSRIALRLMKPDEAEALKKRALDESANPNFGGNQLAYELAGRGWGDLAIEQLRATIDNTADNNVVGRVYDARNLYNYLVLDGGYSQAAEAMQIAIDAPPPPGGQQINIIAPAGGTETLTKEVFMPALHWAKLKAAQERSDMGTVNAELDALAKVSPDSPDITEEMSQDIVSLLDDRGRQVEAKKFFDRFYNWRRTAMDQNPDDPWPKNDFAWYCARCGQNLAVADDIAREAVSMLPHEANCIDTLAYCEYRCGRPSEAVRLETIALSMDRNNFTFIKQLDLFRAAVAAQGKQ
jgi:hypothetical protein